MAITEDDIIKRKLLIEGEGGNDERRITGLLKTFVKWSSSDESPEESNDVYQKMLSILAQCELSMEKSNQVYGMNMREQENYDRLYMEIEKQIEEIIREISECKRELQMAKCIRKNRHEYDALARVIQLHPDRQQTSNQLKVLDEELLKLKETRKKLIEKIDLRQKQLYVLVSSIHELQRILEDDEEEQHTNSSSENEENKEKDVQQNIEEKETSMDTDQT